MSRARRVQILVSLAVVAVIAVAIAVAVGGGGDESEAEVTPTATAEGGGLFAGLPADSMTIGDTSAPATLEEFIDPQCPFCAQFSRDVLPAVVKDYVRTKKLRLVLRPLAFIGEDSVKAARAVAAAGEQDLAWPFMEAVFANQGPENSGYVTDEFLRKVAGQVEGLDADAVIEAANGKAAVPVMQEADARSDEFKVDSTPSFLLAVGSAKPRLLQSNLDVPSFTAALDEALGQ